MSNEETPLTNVELMRILNRGQQAKRILTERIGILEAERAELLAIIAELQSDLSESQTTLLELKTSDDLLAQVASDHGDLHAVPDDSTGVPGR